MRTMLGLKSLRQTVVGAGAAAAITAPTYALHTASGVSPSTYDVTGDSTFQPGMWVHQQFASDSGFTTALVDYYTEVQGSDWEATSETIGGGASVGIAGASQNFTQPTGTYFTRCRFETTPGDTGNNTTSAWSNTVTDTVVSVTTVWNTTSGTNKNANIAISGSPALVATGTTGFGGAPCGVRATNKAVGKRHWEVTLTSLAASEGAYIGFDDGTSALGPSVFPNPPSGFNGYRTDGVLYKNGAVLSGATAGATGNNVAFESDDSAQTLSVWLAGTLLGTISGITAANHWPIASTVQASVLTANFGQSAFSVALSSGYTGMP